MYIYDLECIILLLLLLLKETETDKLCLWAASGNSECVQLSRLDLQLDVKMKTKVTIFNPVIVNFCDNCYLSVNFPHFN